MQKTSKLISLIMVIVLALSVSTMTAFATEEEEETTTTESEFTLTPDGNLTLIDDYIVTTDAGEKEFIVVQSRNGSYFYLVIDRTGNTENVYFLNLVDETDLMAIITEIDPDYQLSTDVGGTTDETQTNADSSIDTTENDTTTTETQTVQSSSTSSMVLLLFVLLALGGGTVYYFKTSKTQGLPVYNEEADNDADVVDNHAQEVKKEVEKVEEVVEETAEETTINEQAEKPVETEKTEENEKQVEVEKTAPVEEVAKPVQVQQVQHAQSRVKTTYVKTSKTQADYFDYPEGESFDEVEYEDEQI